MDERKPLNELAQQLANDAGQRIIKIPGIRAVCVTFVGDEGIPLGAIIYDEAFKDAGTILESIERLTQHTGLLVRALGRYERNHSESLGGQTKHEVKPDRDEPPHNATPDAEGTETAQGADELPTNPDR